MSRSPALNCSYRASHAVSVLVCGDVARHWSGVGRHSACAVRYEGGIYQKVTKRLRKINHADLGLLDIGYPSLSAYTPCLDKPLGGAPVLRRCQSIHVGCTIILRRVGPLLTFLHTE